ncbi:hypothetical protein KL905_000137 [Ogataea polymorpha]|uniref:phosphoadenylyl-sulfate reductase (thioredoxin) n=2 Tax=Ogataea polymorpha TaxID=460523 RepID=A0A9P8T1S4_9ASCO|nr:hypothetical protein KL937_000939 [Ogataea polymorpha]KAG7894900.1 hypothetical protein KL908_001250 [Ogataea polymorpha]KAG7902617.1 hypothetical protein KL935_001525 [Ogataea polymorpha]KAG7911395.1 hypothetical protein KL906_000716 [Ogataea polymorpha]KAG7912772.1 hypothetical protein KL907_000974 [Ogataea polymorpha]
MTEDIVITEYQLQHLNKMLAKLKPQEILQWSIVSFPNLFQTTAFGLTGLCILDMLDKLDLDPVDLVFIDTLYHFPQTHDLIAKVRAKYPKFKLHIYKPKDCDTAEEFQQKHGDELWSKDELKYDFLAKVEPLQRAYKELKIKAVFTGRRRSQGGARSQLPIIEIDTNLNVIKISPLASWDFKMVESYIKEHNVPYNELLDLGYKSIGDWHSTEPVADGEDERAGRWKGKAKTECGIHQTSKYQQFLNEVK